MKQSKSMWRSLWRDYEEFAYVSDIINAELYSDARILYYRSSSDVRSSLESALKKKGY